MQTERLCHADERRWGERCEGETAEVKGKRTMYSNVVEG